MGKASVCTGQMEGIEALGAASFRKRVFAHLAEVQAADRQGGVRQAAAEVEARGTARHDAWVLFRIAGRVICGLATVAGRGFNGGAFDWGYVLGRCLLGLW